jgi:hypothetical protein
MFIVKLSLVIGSLWEWSKDSERDYRGSIELNGEFFIEDKT